MSNFENIVGHEQIIAHIKNAIRNQKVSHAYIINGGKGSGKKLLAQAFAKTLQCENGEAESCGICHSCKQSDSGNQPDIKWVRHEKKSIGVDDIREQVNNDIAIKPYSSRYKIYVIDDAHLMTVQAQNALLKTIEEPPSYGILMLLVEDVNTLLPTIQSRCITLNVKAADLEAVKRFLMDYYQIPDYNARVCAAFSQGYVGRAVKMATSEDFKAMHDQVIQILKRVDDMDIYEIVDAVKSLLDYKLEIVDVIDLMIVWFRDVLMIKATNDPNLLIFHNEYTALNRRAQKSSFNGLDTIISALEKAKVRLAANVNFDLVIELMLLTIKEN